MDGSHVALVALKLDIGLFEVYRCDRTIALGLSLGDLSKVEILALVRNISLIIIDYRALDSQVFKG